jgi:hypothetical protein
MSAAMISGVSGFGASEFQLSKDCRLVALTPLSTLRPVLIPVIGECLRGVGKGGEGGTGFFEPVRPACALLH